MREDVQQESELRRYLLGDSTLEEQVLIEQRLFLDSDYAKLAQAVEDDLIDEYVHKDLVTAEREKFEAHFLKQPEHSDDLRIAQALSKYLDSESAIYPRPGQIDPRSTTLIETVKDLPETPSSELNQTRDENLDIDLPLAAKRKGTLWFALAATVSIIFSVIGWIAIQSERRGGNQNGLQAHDQQPAPSPSNNQPTPSPSLPVNQQSGRDPQTVERRGNQNTRSPNERREKPPQQQPILPALTIFPSSSLRGAGQTNKLTIPFEAKEVTLRLPLILTKAYPNYHFELLSGGRTIHAGDLKSLTDKRLKRVVLVTIPAELLNQQSYEIRLRGLASNGDSSEETTYPFTVENKQ